MGPDPRPITPIDLARYKKVVILTGAGVSVASGIRPFRGPDGIWNEQEAFTAEAMAENPGQVWKLYAARRRGARAAEPNAAHRAIAEFQARAGDESWVCVLTQNVDGLHQRAGAIGVLELHGSLGRSRCQTECGAKPFEDQHDDPETLPTCPECGGPARMDVVLFGEELSRPTMIGMMVAMDGCDLFMAVGTSGLVIPASLLVQQARAGGARTILVNLEEVEEPAFQEHYIGKAEEILPRLLAAAAS